MTSLQHWREIQKAISDVESAEDVAKVRAEIRELPDEDPDRADFAEQLTVVADGLEEPEA